MGSSKKKKEKKKKRQHRSSSESESDGEFDRKKKEDRGYVYDGDKRAELEDDISEIRNSVSNRVADKLKKKRRREETPPPPGVDDDSPAHNPSPPPGGGMDWPYTSPLKKSSKRSLLDDDDEELVHWDTLEQTDESSSWKEKNERNRTRDYQEDVNRKLKFKLREDNIQKEKEKAHSPPPAPSELAQSSASGDGSSLSIEETNKIRIKLGLKPLEMENDESKVKEKGYEDRDDVHQAPKNISEVKETEKFKAKIEAIREKRKVNQKLQKVKGLGEEDDPAAESAAAWVNRSRKVEQDKQLAAKRAKMLEQMDEEFGVSDIVNDTIGDLLRGQAAYTSRDLKNLKVQHNVGTFKEDTSVILTLDDKGILDDDNEDVLVNVNMRDDEHTKKVNESKKKKPDYKAYDEVDEETGMLKIRGVLDKYDQEIEGEKKQYFQLGESGTADGIDDMERIRQTLKNQQTSLDSEQLQVARDYFTEEEMVKFKKPRKKIRKVVRKKNMLKADDLLAMGDADSHGDRGSRDNYRQPKSILKQNNSSRHPESDEEGESAMDIAVPDELDLFVAENNEPVNVADIFEEDEAQNELQMALERSRRQKKTKMESSEDDPSYIEKLANKVLSKPKENLIDLDRKDKKSKKNRGSIVLDSTTEFCRTLGEVPTIQAPPPPTQQDSDDDEEMEIVQEDDQASGNWERVQVPTNGTQTKPKDKEKKEDDAVMEAEPLPVGMAASLQLATMKGYLNDGKKVKRLGNLNLPETKAEVDVEKLRDEEKSRYSGRDRDRGGRDREDRYEGSFKEMKNYKPDFKIEYVDPHGRPLSQKEAFRVLSHKFHGKGSGKAKTAKRANKLKEEEKLQMMSSIDTPLNTAALFKDKQSKSQSAHIVLSGGGKSLLSEDTLKK